MLYELHIDNFKLPFTNLDHNLNQLKIIKFFLFNLTIKYFLIFIYFVNFLQFL